MTKFEYKVLPAPKKPGKIKGLKRGEDKFAASLTALMNELGAEGWEFQRSDTLPVESRSGLTNRTTTFHTMLVFRRIIHDLDDEVEVTPVQEMPVIAAAEPPEIPAVQPPEPIATPQETLVETQVDTQVETRTASQPEISNAKA